MIWNALGRSTLLHSALRLSADLAPPLLSLLMDLPRQHYAVTRAPLLGNPRRRDMVQEGANGIAPHGDLLLRAMID
jgi:hypothetical protein